MHHCLLYFYGWIILHCMDRPNFVYYLVDRQFWLLWVVLLWTLVYKFLCGHSFHFFWVLAKDRTANFYGNSNLKFWGTAIFPPKKPLHHFLFSPAVYVWVFLSLSALVIDCLLDFRHPSECEVVWLCISLMNNSAYFHVLLYIVLICITSLDNSLQMLCPYFNWVICLSVAEYL